VDQVAHEYYVQWIIADYTPIQYNGYPYFISTPSRDNRFIAESIYKNTYENAIENGAIDDGGLNKLLLKYYLWDTKKEELVNKLNKEVEQLKVDMYKNFSSKNTLSILRHTLLDTNKYLNKLYHDKHQMDFLGAAFVASTAKHNYLMGASLFKRRNIPLYRSMGWFQVQDDSIINIAYKTMSNYMLSEVQYRELARSVSWRNIWSLKRNGGNIFGRSTADFSAQQRQIVMYSNMYDNIYKNTDCPGESVINDDDVLDGWMIEQRRKREKDASKTGVLNKIPDNISSCEEQFVICGKETEDGFTYDDIYQCNDVAGKMAFKIRQSQLEKEGVVPEQKQKDRLMQMLNKGA